MKFPRWVFMYLKKLPPQFVGEVHLIVRQTGTVEIARHDKVTEKLFYERWAETTNGAPLPAGGPDA